MDWNVPLSFSVDGNSAADFSIGAFAGGFVLCFEPECEKRIVGGTDSLSGVKWVNNEKESDNPPLHSMK